MWRNNVSYFLRYYGLTTCIGYAEMQKVVALNEIQNSSISYFQSHVIIIAVLHNLLRIKVLPIQSDIMNLHLENDFIY